MELYRQLSTISLTIKDWLKSVSELSKTTRVNLQLIKKCLHDLNKLVTRIVENSKISRLVCALERVNSLFQEIRRVLGQEEKSGTEIKTEISACIASHQSDQKFTRALEIVNKRFKMYENELYIAYDNDSVPRTNNDLEDFNNGLKRAIRKGQGKKESWFYVEHQGISVAYYHDLLKAPHRVGGTDIVSNAEQTPLERIGALETVSVSAIMALIDKTAFYTILAKNDESYTVHRWTKKIFKQGLNTCLNALNFNWKKLIKSIFNENKFIIGGETSIS